MNDSGQEVIVMGKGIGFGKKAGGDVREDEIQKTFVLKERTALQNIIRLASEVFGIALRSYRSRDPKG